MVVKISGETPVQILSHSLSVSPSNESYYFEYSADGENYTTYSEETPSGENLIVNGIAFGQYIRLKGNASEVTIVY